MNIVVDSAPWKNTNVVRLNTVKGFSCTRVKLAVFRSAGGSDLKSASVVLPIGLCVMVKKSEWIKLICLCILCATEPRRPSPRQRYY